MKKIKIDVEIEGSNKNQEKQVMEILKEGLEKIRTDMLVTLGVYFKVKKIK